MNIARFNWAFAVASGAAAVIALFVLDFIGDRYVMTNARAYCADSEIDYVSTRGWGAWVECTALEGSDDGD